ncbi:MFS transporter [Pseudonocardiaceae bacterium YIM PH 21723]|nr:MFS transporter [Pseudonocardiaceae bacterium YIM PH 21723]
MIEVASGLLGGPGRGGGLLRDRDFAVLLTARVQSTAGDQLSRVALWVLVYRATGSAAWPAVAFGLSMAASAMALWLAPWASRFALRRVIRCCAVLSALLVAAMAIPGVPWWCLILIAMAGQAVGGVYRATQTAALRQVVPPQQDVERFKTAVSAQQTADTVAALAGLPVAGLVIAAAGPYLPMLIDAVTFVLAGLLVGRVVGRADVPVLSRRVSLLETVCTVWTDRRLVLLLGFIVLSGITIVPEALSVGLAHQFGRPDAIWLVAVSEPAGYVVGASPWIQRLLSSYRWARGLGWFAIGSFVPLIGAAWMPNLGAVCALLVVSGIASGHLVTVLTLYTAWSQESWLISAQVLGRTVLIGAQGMASGLGGLAGEVLSGPAAAVTAAGVFGAVSAVAVTVAWRSLLSSPREVVLPAG